MRKILGCFIFLIIMMTSQIFASTVYYVDATNGNDNDTGTSEDHAWQTLIKVNTSSFNAGDTILLKRGEEWREYLQPPSSGNSGNHITFDAYGSGNLPIINSADIETGWSHTQDYIYEKTFSNEPYVVVEDDTFLRYAKWNTDVSTTFSGETAGCWSQNGNTAYVWCTDNADPDTHTMEVGSEASDSNSQYGIFLENDKIYITIQNIEVRYATTDGIKVIAGNDTDVSNIIVQNCKIWLCGRFGFDADNWWNSTDQDHPITNLTINNNDISYCGSHGIEFNFEINNSTVSNNSIYYCGWDQNVVWGAHGITAWSNSLAAGPSNNIIEHNEVHHIYLGPSGLEGTGIQADDYTNNCIYRYNIVYDNQGSGLIDNIGSDNSWYYNISYSNNTSSSAVKGGMGANYAYGIKIYNNVFYDNSDNGLIFVGSFTSGTVKNNIFMDNGNYEIMTYMTNAPTSDYNCIYHSAGGSYMGYNTAAKTWSEWKTLTGGDDSSITSDPLVIDVGNKDFHLQAGSPCIDAGVDVGLVEDYDGHTVPYGWGADIGAYEYTGVSPLDANINAFPTSGQVPLAVNFTGSATGGTEPYTYSWDFGDSTSSGEQNPSHSYNDAGDYTVTLTVTDNQSNQDSDSLTINASAVIIPLAASFIASPTSGEVPLTVNFTGSATGGTEPYTYTWEFGDSTSSGEQNPSHTYNDAGDYTVNLTVTDSQSNQDSDSLTINANAVIIPLAASFIASPVLGEVPLTVNFTGIVTGGVLPYSFSWDFGDGTSSSEQNPSHIYSEAGDYTVYLTVTDSESNQDNDSLIISTSAPTNSAYLSCSPKSIYFGATTSGNETTDQYLRIINAGSGTLTWNIEDDADWLSCSPSSGTDRGEITVSVNDSGLSLGLYIATIIVSSPEAYNSPQYVSVNFRVYEPEEENSPFGSLDTQVDGSTVSGSIPITGWALDDIELIRLGIKRNSDPLDPLEAIGSDGLVYIGDAVFVEGARPDQEDGEGRLRIGIKEVRRGYRLQVDDDREINTKSILNTQIEEMEPLRIVFEGSSGRNIKYIGWGENESEALPVGSTLDREKGIFLWIPTPGFIGRYVLHFTVTDGSYMSKPLRVEVDVIPKS